MNEEMNDQQNKDNEEWRRKERGNDNINSMNRHCNNNINIIATQSLPFSRRRENITPRNIIITWTRR